jgi:DNA-binding transcriptional MerR regulator
MGLRMTNQLDRDSSEQDVIWIDQHARPKAVPVAAAAQPEHPEFTISELAKEFGVTLRTLRFYEDRGLLSPRRVGMARLYSPADRERLALILKGKKLGFMLGEIRQMVAAREGQADSKGLQLSREKCLEQIEMLNRQQADIESALAELREIYASLSAQVTEADAVSH